MVVWPTKLPLPDIHFATFYGQFHLLPCKLADPTVKSDCEHFPFKVVSGGGDKPSIEGEAATCVCHLCVPAAAGLGF